MNASRDLVPKEENGVEDPTMSGRDAPKREAGQDGFNG